MVELIFPLSMLASSCLYSLLMLVLLHVMAGIPTDYYTEYCAELSTDAVDYITAFQKLWLLCIKWKLGDS